MWDDSRETKYWDDWAEDRPFSIVTIFGNHENYHAIRSLPLEEWNGALVRKVRPHVTYVENGEIFTLNNKKFFCMGGATSIDKAYRKEGKSWWPEEMPSKEEMEHAATNLERCNMKVDYVLSHTPPNFILDKWWNEHDSLTNFLSNYVDQFVDFKYHFFGHLHLDDVFEYNNKKYIGLYHSIMEIM